MPTMSIVILPSVSWGRQLRGTPPRMNPARLTEMTVHYTGAPRVALTADQVPGYIKSIERGHLARTSSHFSAVGYNFAIDKWGRIWELRGFDYRNAANGTSSNTTSFSVCVLVGVEDNHPTREITAALQALYAEGCRRAGRQLVVKGHREHKATACPGSALMDLVGSGQIQRQPVKPAPTPARPTAPTLTTYTVQRGDSYWGIATKVLGAGTRWKEISDLNGGRPLTPGTAIAIPGAGSASAQNSPAQPPAAEHPLAAVARAIAAAKRHTLRRGSGGRSATTGERDAVTWCQTLLSQRGFNPGPADGHFGPRTEATVRAFQTNRKLHLDGICGPQTWTALAG